jgi:hypothetical protein
LEPFVISIRPVYTSPLPLNPLQWSSPTKGRSFTDSRGFLASAKMRCGTRMSMNRCSYCKTDAILPWLSGQPCPKCSGDFIEIGYTWYSDWLIPNKVLSSRPTSACGPTSNHTAMSHRCWWLMLSLKIPIIYPSAARS